MTFEARCFTHSRAKFGIACHLGEGIAQCLRVTWRNHPTNRRTHEFGNAANGSGNDWSTERQRFENHEWLAFVVARHNEQIARRDHTEHVARGWLEGDHIRKAEFSSERAVTHKIRPATHSDESKRRTLIASSPDRSEQVRIVLRIAVTGDRHSGDNVGGCGPGYDCGQ